MSTEVSSTILTADESSVIELLQYVNAEADDFDDPENGDFLNRMQTLFRNSTELDAAVVKIALDRTHFFMGDWTESSFSGDSYNVTPSTSAATDRLEAALESTTVTKSTGIKNEVLKIVDRLQVDYFWRDTEHPDARVVQSLIDVIEDHNVKDAVLAEFVQWNILFPWSEHLGLQYTGVAVSTEHAEWQEQCRRLNAIRW